MMEKKRDRKRLARVCVLAAAITLGSAWHVSGAQTDEAVTPAGELLQESSVKTEGSQESDFQIEDGVLKKYLGDGGDVVIPDGVTSIGYEAFKDCDSLVSVSIPGSVTSIGGSAFENCDSLVSVSIPGSVTSIGGSAFENCDSLVSVSIPGSVTSIGNLAFYDCGSLTSIELPGSVKSIGNYAFYDCDSLVSVSIPGSVTMFGDYAFEKCDSLASVSISDGVTEIGYCAFDHCSSLTSIEIPSSVGEIESGAFFGCSKLLAINVADGNEKYSSQNGVLFNKEKTVLLKYPEGKEDEIYQIPGSVTMIGDYAFARSSSLTSMEIPNIVTMIGKGAFFGCSKLLAIDVADRNWKYSSQNGVLFDKEKTVLLKYPEGKEETAYQIPDGVTKIGYSAFINCSSLASVTIPESVTEIGDSAFENCSSLKSVTIPKSVTYIERYAFKNCSSLASVKISDGVTRIGYSAFGNCSSLISIEIPNSVWYIDGDAFFGCSKLLAIDVADGNEEYSSQNGVLFDKEKTVLLKYPEGKEETAYQIPDGVTKIGGSAFENCSSLASVTIPESVTGIGDSAFENCSSLTSVTIPKSVTDIGIDVFLECPPSLTIYCERYSTAETYAKRYNIPCEYIDESGDTGTKKPQTITAKNITKTYGARAFSLGAKASGGGKLTYSVSDPKVAAVSNKGIVTIKGWGVTKITIKAAATGTYDAAEKTITLTVKAKKQTIKAKDITKTYGAKAFSLGAKASGGKLTYTVSDKKVAAVSKTGRVTIKGCGVTKIKIKAAASKNHAAAAKTITLTVKPKQQKISSLKSQKAKTLTVKWKKDAKATGYILQYSMDKKFKKAVKTVTIKKNGTAAKTLSKLNGGKKYYVRVCSYKTSGGKAIRGTYSSVKPVTVKK